MQRAHLYGSTMTLTLDMDCCWKAPLRAIMVVFISAVKPPWLTRRGVFFVGSGFSVALAGAERLTGLCASVRWEPAALAGWAASEAEAAKDLQNRMGDCLRNSSDQEAAGGIIKGSMQR